MFDNFHPVGLLCHCVYVVREDQWEIIGIYLNRDDAVAHHNRVKDSCLGSHVGAEHQFGILFGDQPTAVISDSVEFFLNFTALAFGRLVVVGVWSKEEDAAKATGQVTCLGPKSYREVGKMIAENRAA